MSRDTSTHYPPLKFELISKRNPRNSKYAGPFIGRTYTRELPFVAIKIFKGRIRLASAN